MSPPAIPPADLEKYSSAISLSDMEIYIFPELLYSLVLANILSPRLWAWRDDPWFEGILDQNEYRRVLRLKQFVMDRYEFNLDLDTWGLTRKDTELARFRPWMDEADLARSNALFGYEGDKYYFDIDIRRHFGLDRYTSDIIPYWKTETVEAMDAFVHRDGYRTGAGECVSLSTLYAAALFVVCGIPLDRIWLLATPLHSQNFVDVKDGVLTNNRRVVTRNMWFNGTETTAKAQRALRNEQVTIVAHVTGHIHVMYPEATIAPEAYDAFRTKLTAFMHADVDLNMLASFLRATPDLHDCFQLRHEKHGRPCYIPAARAFAYEASSPGRIGDRSQNRLLDDIDDDEFYPQPLTGKILLNKFEAFFRQHQIDLDHREDVVKLMEEISCQNARAWDIIQELKAFCRLTPRLPDPAKRRIERPPLGLEPGQTREEMRAALEALRDRHPVADLALYAYRDLAATDWTPFLIAALERNPVVVEGLKDVPDADLADRIADLADASIYDSPRAAQPDEVWNFRRGDGLEKAIALATVWKARRPADPIELTADGARTTLRHGPHETAFNGSKGLRAEIDLQALR